MPAGCHASPSSTAASWPTGSGRTRSGSSSAITWNSLRRRCLSGRNSQSCSEEQGQKGGDWPGDGKYVPAVPWKTHPSLSSDLGPVSLFGLKLLWCCCLMTCRVTPEADLVLKVPVSSAIKQQDCSGHDLHCFLASPTAPFIIHLCLGVPKARTHRALHCQARASNPLDHLVCGCGWQWEAVPSLSGLQITSLMGFLCQKSASNDPFILVN